MLLSKLETSGSAIRIATNRFDLRDNLSFNDCGEYRVIFARNDGQRNFIIFEASVPNPTPGVASGCRPIQQFWQGLTTQNAPTVRSQLLRDFYFNGLPAAGVRAPIDIRNQPSAYGLTSANSVGPSQSWPDSGFFVHVNEISNSSGAFPLSPALINVFLPTRKLDMESFLNNPASTGKPGQTTPTTPTGKRSG